MAEENLQVLLRARPDPSVTADLFEPVRAPVPAVADGQFLVRA